MTRGRAIRQRLPSTLTINPPNPNPRPNRCPAPITVTVTPRSTSRASSVRMQHTLRPRTQRHGSTRNRPAPAQCCKSPGTGAMLCFMGHALMENRHGLVVQGDLSQPPSCLMNCSAIACRAMDGHAERRAALDMVHRHSPGSTRRLTLGADKGYDAAEFVSDLREACITPHVAQKSRYSAIPSRDIARSALPDNGRVHHPTSGLRPVDQAPKADRGGLWLGQYSRWRGANCLSRRRTGAIWLHSDDGRQ